jgi:hypothetical protein
VTNKIRLSWIGETHRLTAENSLAESPVEEGVLHIEQLNQPFTGGSNGEHRADDGRLHIRVESLLLVNPGVLCEILEDPARLVTIERPIGEELVHEDPLASDDVGATGPEYRFPCPIAH